MKIQEQKWHDFTRLLIVDDDGGCMGSVLVELFPHTMPDGTSAYIYSLWVDEPYRRNGMAQRLMDAAEDEARKRGHKSATLQWRLEDTPVAIRRWYERRGYKAAKFGASGEWALMVKKL